MKKGLTRYVYLMQRTGGRGRKKIIKIGIAKNPKSRLKQINRSVKGKIILLDAFKVLEASKVEKELHQLFKKQNHKLTGAGGSEFFRLTNYQIKQVRVILSKHELRREKRLFLYFTGIGVFLIFIYHKISIVIT